MVGAGVVVVVALVVGVVVGVVVALVVGVAVVVAVVVAVGVAVGVAVAVAVVVAVVVAVGVAVVVGGGEWMSETQEDKIGDKWIREVGPTNHSYWSLYSGKASDTLEAEVTYLERGKADESSDTPSKKGWYFWLTHWTDWVGPYDTMKEAKRVAKRGARSKG